MNNIRPSSIYMFTLFIVVTLFLTMKTMSSTVGDATERHPTRAVDLMNSEIDAALPINKPKFYPRVVSVDKNILTYRIYEYPSGTAAPGADISIDLTNTPAGAQFDWETGKMMSGRAADNTAPVKWVVESGNVKIILDKSLAALRPGTVSSVFANACQTGATFPRPTSDRDMDLARLVSIDARLSGDRLPAVSETGMMLREYGVCTNGQPEWKSCGAGSVYTGRGQCTAYDFETYRCLNHLADTPNTVIELTDPNNKYFFYSCLPKAPYTERKMCPAFMVHDGARCTPDSVCRNARAPVPVPEELRAVPAYLNSYVSCDNPIQPRLVKCDLGLQDDMVRCNDQYSYTYIYSDETYEMKSFRIGRNRVDAKTGITLDREKADIINVKEYVYKNIDRKTNKDYNKIFDMYIDYPIPTYYFDGETGERKTVATFRDCHQLYKQTGLRVYSEALKSYLKFCSLSLYVRIDLNYWISPNLDLGVNYGHPIVLTDAENNEIESLLKTYPDQPIYTTSIKYKKVLYEYSPSAKLFDVSKTDQTLIDGYGYITNTFYKLRTPDTRVAIIKGVKLFDHGDITNVINGTVKHYENSFGFTFRREIKPLNVPTPKPDGECKSTDKILQDIILNVQNSVVINNSLESQPFCLNGKKLEEAKKTLPCNNILGLKLNLAKTNCFGFENIGPVWLNVVNKDPKHNTYFKLNRKFNELNINANTDENNLLMTISDYNKLQ